MVQTNYKLWYAANTVTATLNNSMLIMMSIILIMIKMTMIILIKTEAYI